MKTTPEYDPLYDLQRDVRDLRGSTALVDMVAQGWGEGTAAAAPKKTIGLRYGSGRTRRHR